MKYLYLASTSSEDIRRMVQLADLARDCGFAPFLPHLHYFQDLIMPHDREYWLALELDWVRRCDALVRLGGESSGSEQEHALAVELGLPVLELDIRGDWRSGLNSLRRKPTEP